MGRYFKYPTITSEKNIVRLTVLVTIILFIFPFWARLKSLSGENYWDVEAWWGALVFAWQYSLRPVFVGLGIICIIVGIYACIRFWPLRSKVSLFEKPTMLKALPKKDAKIIKHWDKIASMANTATAENMRLAVLEADALVDSFLKGVGYEGEHMADRLGKIRIEEVKSVEGVWRAHRLRNDIVHTPGYRVTGKQAAKALNSYRNFLMELGAI